MSFNLRYPHELEVQKCPGAGNLDLLCYIGGVGAAGDQPVGDKAFCGIQCDGGATAVGAYAQVDLTGNGTFWVGQGFNCSAVQIEYVLFSASS